MNRAMVAAAAAAAAATIIVPTAVKALTSLAVQVVETLVRGGW